MDSLIVFLELVKVTFEHLQHPHHTCLRFFLRLFCYVHFLLENIDSLLALVNLTQVLSCPVQLHRQVLQLLRQSCQLATDHILAAELT